MRSVIDIRELSVEEIDGLVATAMDKKELGTL